MMSNRLVNIYLIITVFVIGSACAGKMNLSSVLEEDVTPLTIYVVSDVHVGNTDSGEKMMAFVSMVNRNKPDVVLDLGDTFQAEISDLYPLDSHKKAAISQHNDWLKAWNSINVRHKAVALGNRDLQTIIRSDRSTLTEEIWIKNLGYEDKPVRGGTKLQESFILEGKDVRALFFVLGTYTESFSMEETMNWIREEVAEFEGDFIVFSNHSVGIYDNIRSVLIKNNVETPVLYLHGHNHGPDTLVRDAWGREQEDFNFPSYLLTEFLEKGVGAKFELYPGGRYEKYRVDVINNTISEPVMHHQTRVVSN